MDIKKTKEILRSGKTIYDLPLKVAYYARVSTDKDDQLNSLENQQHYFEEMIRDNKNWLFAGAYIDEGISGTAVKNRKEFLKMIDDSTLGHIDLILTKEISRFSRNTIDSIKYTEYLLKNGVIVHFLSDNLNTIQEDAEFRLTIMSSLAQDEIRKLSERVKFGINRMIKERKLLGGNLTGYYKKDGRYTINPNEAPIITYLFEAYVSGNVSLHKIAQDLANLGYTNSKGLPYSQATLAKFLTNPRYKGYYTARLTEVEDYKTHRKRKLPDSEHIIEKDTRIPAIITEDLWNAANELYQKRKRHPNRHILNSDKALKESKYSNIMYCYGCHNVFIRNGGSNRVNNPTWCCKTYKTKGLRNCASPNLPEKLLDEKIAFILNAILPKKKLISEMLNDYRHIMCAQSSNKQKSDIETQLQKINAQKEKLLDLRLQDTIDDITYQKRNNQLTEKAHLLKNKLIHQKTSDTTKCLQQISRYLSKEDILSQLIKCLINKITIQKISNNRHNLNLEIDFTFPRNKELVNLDFRH